MMDNGYLCQDSADWQGISAAFPAACKQCHTLKDSCLCFIGIMRLLWAVCCMRMHQITPRTPFIISSSLSHKLDGRALHAGKELAGF